MKELESGAEHFFLNYQATLHSSTGVPLATVLFGRDIKTTLPQLTFNTSKPDIKQKDDESKLKMKEMKAYTDKRHRAKESHITISNATPTRGDRKHNKNLTEQ